jgi:uncharacterized membrane protein YkvI
MESGDRVSAIIAGFMSAAFVATVFLVSSCTLEQSKEKTKVTQMEIPLKMECLKNHGIWVPRDNDGRPPYVCKF